MKIIGHAITYHILIFSWNPNRSHSMTCTKMSLKGPKRQEILKIELLPGQNSHDNSLGGVSFYQFCGIIVYNLNN